MADTTNNSDFGSWVKYLIGTASDVYGKTIDAKTTQKANEASAKIAQAESDNKFKIGNYEVSVTQALAVVALATGIILVAVIASRR